MKIQDIMKLSAEIQNFYDCYDATNKLYAKRQIDGAIQAEDLLEFLIENPHLAEIALKIKDFKMDLNDCIAETVSLAEYCEDKETKDILLNHLKELLDLQLREDKHPHKEQNKKLPVIFNCLQCSFRNEVKNTFSAKWAVLSCKSCGHYNTVNIRGNNES